MKCRSKILNVSFKVSELKTNYTIGVEKSKVSFNAGL